MNHSYATRACLFNATFIIHAENIYKSLDNERVFIE